MSLDYKLVVPSRGRAHRMPKLMSLIPDATVCVSEHEHDEYAQHVPEAQIVTHPPDVIGEPKKRNWMVDNIDSPILIQCDDDLEGVQVTTGSYRYITDPVDIKAIYENAMQCCHDLGLGIFCFARTGRSMSLDSDLKPIWPVAYCFNFVGMMNNARNRHYDETMPARCDVDFTLRTLLEDRIVFGDARFYFDFGPAFSGEGGLTGLVSKRNFEEGTRMLAKRWGKYISFESPYWQKNRMTSSGSLRVRRSSGKGIQ